MKTQTIGMVAVGVVIVAGALWYMQNGAVPSLSTNLPGEVLSPTSTGQTTTGAGSSGNPTGGSTSGSAQTGGAKTYSSTAYGFSFQYPSSMTLETSGFAPGGFTAQGAVGVVSVSSRMDTVVDRFTVSVSSEPSDLGKCTGGTTNATIGGIPVVKAQSTETKEGQDITTTTYRVMRNTMCYELRDTVVTSVTAELTATQKAQQNANIAASTALVGSILQTFTFR